MPTRLPTALLVEAFDGSLVEGAVHPLNLAIGLRMPGRGEPVRNVEIGTGHLEGMAAESCLFRCTVPAFDGADRE